MKLTYPTRIPADDLLGRVLGPDALGGFVCVTDVTHTNSDEKEATYATVRPVPPASMRNIGQDAFGQLWLVPPR